MDNRYVGSPYNFIEFANSPFTRYDSISELPSHKYMDPNLKSGIIRFSLTADSPVFIWNGKKENPPDSLSCFMKSADGRYIIPGSSVRGLIRQNMHILGMGCISRAEIDNVQLFYREFASSRNSVLSPLGKRYTAILTPSNKYAASIGYIVKQDGSYYIYPASGELLKIKRSSPLCDWSKDATIKEIFYKKRGDEVTDLQIEKPSEKENEWLKGVLLCTGAPVGKGNPRYIFPECDYLAQPEYVENEDIVNYKTDFEFRKNALPGTRAERCDPEFWNLPSREGDAKPVFYIRYNGHLYFGMSKMIRIGHEYKITDGLPEKHGEFCGIDYPNAIMGFASDKEAYRSRVSFFDCYVNNDVKEGAPVAKTLGQPRPGFSVGYVKSGQNYSDSGFQLRGYKQYWFKNSVDTTPSDKPRTASTIRSLPAGTVFKGEIRYKNLHVDELGLLLWCLRLDNGKDPQTKYYHGMGMGKPYGYGRMFLNIDELIEWNCSDLYNLSAFSDVIVDGKRDLNKRIDDYIEEYNCNYSNYIINHNASFKKKSKGSKNNPIRKRSSIADFMFMRSTIRRSEDVRYMELDDFKNIPSLPPTVRDIRLSPDTGSTIQNETKDEDALWQALGDRFGPKHRK